ncbi:hypothetical protein, partial [Gluconobacter japonicus]|uniref:hypothetical protein n=1 Tax=Gluconobacter japonicus TaxID=376620 RepID=UPI0039EB8F56
TTTDHGRGLSSSCPAMAMSGFGRSSVTVSGETTSYHHTCIAVFLGKHDFAVGTINGQATSSVVSAS